MQMQPCLSTFFNMNYLFFNKFQTEVSANYTTWPSYLSALSTSGNDVQIIFRLRYFEFLLQIYYKLNCQIYYKKTNIKLKFLPSNNLHNNSNSLIVTKINKVIQQKQQIFIYILNEYILIKLCFINIFYLNIYISI